MRDLFPSSLEILHLLSCWTSLRVPRLVPEAELALFTDVYTGEQPLKIVYNTDVSMVSSAYQCTRAGSVSLLFAVEAFLSHLRHRMVWLMAIGLSFLGIRNTVDQLVCHFLKQITSSTYATFSWRVLSMLMPWPYSGLGEGIVISCFLHHLWLVIITPMREIAS